MTANGNRNMVVKESTKARLDAAKRTPEEYYDTVINRALDALEKNAPKVPAGVTA